MVKWSGSDRYDLPNDPGPLTRLWWFLEDWWRGLDSVDKTLLGLAAFAVAMAISIVLRAPV